ncbi:hypothetical protein GPA27_29045 [Aromatoleum toluolicum]|uniref:hypothetical protein n=1 Tax=Aromatoleum toluolicum TaxID=90060 RepID=UPI001B7D0A7B|nr:hypothetical protein [Aromatoleum toluolicum]MCQ6964034.1 hypothetical protein [Aromatoleum toluolicum]
MPVPAGGYPPTPCRCSHCGVEILLADPERGDGGQLCERCFLQSIVGDDPCCAGVLSGFAEALVDTLDLREHETGLHSRRVACHTLVLARHITDDEQRLRECSTSNAAENRLRLFRYPQDIDQANGIEATCHPVGQCGKASIAELSLAWLAGFRCSRRYRD